MATRVFKYNDQVWEDPGEGFSNDYVRKHLTQFFPELERADIQTKALEDGTTEVRFVKRAGTKGGGLGITCGEVAERLATIEPLEIEGFGTALRLLRGDGPDEDDVAERIGDMDALEVQLDNMASETRTIVNAVMGVAACPSQQTPLGF
jgi:PRTRC genetic system protein C